MCDTLCATFLPTKEDYLDFCRARFFRSAGSMPRVLQNIGLYFLNRSAAAEFDAHPPLACTVSFSEAGVRLETQRYRGRLPWGKLCGCVLTETTLLLYLSATETRFVPARVFQKKQWQKILHFYREQKAAA